MVFKWFVRQRNKETGDDTTKQSVMDAVNTQLNTEIDSVYNEISEPDEIIITVTIISNKKDE